MSKEKDNNQDKQVVQDKLSKKGWLSAIFSPKKYRIATAMVYERIDKTEVYIGSYPLMQGRIKDLGEYCYLNIKGKKIFMNPPHPNDYTPAKNNEIGKILEVVKFAEDDYRVRGKLNDTFYTMKKRQVTEAVHICQNCTQKWNDCVCNPKQETYKATLKKPVFNKDGTPKYEEIKETWLEPKGVTQEGRSVLREQYAYIKKMEEHKAKNDFFTKYGAIMTIAIVALACVFMVIFSVNQVTKNLQMTVDKVGQVSKDMQWWKDPNALRDITSAVTTQQTIDQKVKNTPPT